MKNVEKRVQERGQLEHGEKRPKIFLDEVVALDGVARPERGVDLGQLKTNVGWWPGLPANPRGAVEVDVVERLDEDGGEGRVAQPCLPVSLGKKGKKISRSRPLQRA